MVMSLLRPRTCLIVCFVALYEGFFNPDSLIANSCKFNFSLTRRQTFKKCNTILCQCKSSRHQLQDLSKSPVGWHLSVGNQMLQMPWDAEAVHILELSCSQEQCVRTMLAQLISGIITWLLDQILCPNAWQVPISWFNEKNKLWIKGNVH